MTCLGVAGVAALLLMLVVGGAWANVFLHNPRGSNNRLNEETTDRANANRMFDSQNTGRGGYAWGPKMYYYAGSQLEVEWTSEHGCGPDSEQPNVHCDVVLQYMCGDEVRDGLTTDTIPDDPAEYNAKGADKLNNNGKLAYVYGMHEPYAYYQDCHARQRNRGLFLADVVMPGGPGADARNTRQNPGGARSGFECPEERDYYPYWHPAPWRDIAVLTSNVSRCDYYRANSQNVVGRGYCHAWPAANNARDCAALGGKWVTAPPNGGGPVDCRAAPYARDNGLGWVSSYNWTIPHDALHESCVLRLRYNISVGDYDGWNTYSDQNEWNPFGNKCPITRDPTVQFDTEDTPVISARNLTLALDTRQTGRTFQDRSYTFAIRPRPAHVGPNDRIVNLNVKGKRGTLTQVFPAVMYDFVPNSLYMRPGDYLHLQWTGSTFNPANNEGTYGTDITNLVQVADLYHNVPLNFSDPRHFFGEKARLALAHLNQKGCDTLAQLLARHGPDQEAINRDPRNCAKLNMASTYQDQGLHQVHSSLQGLYMFISTRNNNFSKRSQKLKITVLPDQE